ncbi:hybrid sensor histidine kinase/response regulator [Brevundimonas faecalis]|uniref:histidine kinase n=1 Tax=Brevundimonas faecalis TaxID=947378 RepID=A0ABV2R6P6_9CAUL
MKGRWRAFRHEAGQTAGPPPLVYVVLFGLCLLLGHWSADTFKAVIVWPANGVMLAAFLQLKRRQALGVLAACFVLNLASTQVRGDVAPFDWLNPTLNLIQVLVAGVLARRICGAALDMRRPRRILMFICGAAAAAVALTVTVNVAVATVVKDYSTVKAIFAWRHLFAMELLGLATITPSLLLLARAHCFTQKRHSQLEMTLVLGVVTVAALWIFTRQAPLLFLMFPPLMLAAFRLSPPGVAAALLITTVISGLMTMTGHGPVTIAPVPDVPGLNDLPERLRQMPLYYGFLLAATATALPISALMAERRSFLGRLARRTAAAHEQRQRAEAADAAKSRFLALMSHEMRTPLNGVSGYADLLARRTDLSPEARDQVEAIRQSGEGMLSLVEDVLEISRGDAPLQSEPFDLETMIQDVLLLETCAARAKGIRLETMLASGLPRRFVGDGRRLRSALRHLVSNGIKFTDHGVVRLKAAYADGDLSLEVSDTGIGVGSDLAPRLFDVFAQGDDSLSRRHSGTGVGLPIVRRHARCMGGDVTLVATSPFGSTFRLKVPLQALETPEIVAPEHEPAPLRALIVDDHPVNRRMLSLLVGVGGYETVEAEDGEQAVEAAGLERFDLILMDVRMPRMDGLEATRRIRAMPFPACDTPILAVTADAMPEDAARCLAAGMDAHLAKPITHDRLYLAIEQACRAAFERRGSAAA